MVESTEYQQAESPSVDAHLNAMKFTQPVVYNRLIPSGNDYVGFLMSPEILSTLGPSE